MHKQRATLYFVLFVVFLFSSVLAAPAQTKKYQYREQGYIVFGVGTGSRIKRTVEQIGGGGELFVFRGFAVGLDLGYGNCFTCELWSSGDLIYHFRPRVARTTKGADPFVLAGGGGIFPSHNGFGYPAVNYGGGVNLWLARRTALRIEFRDNFNGNNFGYGNHYYSFRFGVTFR